MSKILKENPYLQVLIIIFLGLFIFLRSDPFKVSVEKNIYDYYSESIVKDHDLNVINQVPDKERWQITQSGNYPDVHSNGIISFWSPFFIYKNIVASAVPLTNSEAIFLTRTMATNFYAIVSLVLLFFWIKKDLGLSPKPLVLTAFFLGVSFFWYAVFQPGNADVTSLFVAILELILFREIVKENKPVQYFFMGLLLGIGIALKIDHFFYLILPLYLFWNQFKQRRNLKNVFNSILLFGFGYLLNVIPLIVNDRIKFGYWEYGYRAVVSSDFYLLWENLFYPSGFLTNNPIFVFSFVGLLFLVFEKKKDYELITIGLIPVVSIVVESFARIHQESYGGRHWIAYLPSLLFLYLYFFKKIETFNLKKSYRIFISLLLFLTILQNANKLFRYIINYDKFFLGADQLQDMVDFFNQRSLGVLIDAIFTMPQASIKLAYFSPIIWAGIGSAIWCYWYFILRSNKLTRFIYVVTIFVTSSYFIMTLLNVENNNKNFHTFRETGALKKAIVGNGPHIHSLFENLGTTEKALTFYRENKKFEKVKLFKKFRSDYVKLAAAEIIYDPVGFKARLESDTLNFIDQDIRAD